MLNKFSILIFIYLILLQVISIYVGYDIDDVRVLFRLTLFETGFVIALFILMIGAIKFFKKETNIHNRLIIKIIFIYVIYQVAIIFPLSVYEANLPLTHLVRNLLPRLFLLLIPFLYWFVIPSFKNNNTPIKWINYSSILLFIIAIYNYTTNTIMITSTGDLRLISGVAAIMFAFTLVTNISLFGANKNNIFYIIISLLGLIFVNHRAAYLGIGFIIILSFFFSLLSNLNFKKIIYSLLIFSFLFIVSLNIKYVQENFYSRIAASFDYEDHTARDRLIRWGLSFNYFLDNPINGSKLENKYYADDEMLRELYPPHNFIFEILATQGIIGFIFVALLLFYILKLGYINKVDSLSYQMFFVIIFYIFYALLNVTFLNQWNIMILVLPSAMILYRNKLLSNKINHLNNTQK